MRGESYPGLKNESDSIEVRPENLDTVVEHLVGLRQKMIEQQDRARTSGLKHEVAESQQLAEVYSCGYESGVAVLDELLPIVGRSWKQELEDLDR